MVFGLIVAGVVVFLVLRVVYQITTRDYLVPGWDALRSDPEARRSLALDVVGKAVNAGLILAIRERILPVMR
jgi:hypothetical protein